MKTKIFTLLLVLGALVFTSCSDDEEIATSNVNLQFELPAGLAGAKSVKLIEGSLLLTNENTGVETIEPILFINALTLSVEDGVYSITGSGKVTYTTTVLGQSVERSAEVRLFKQNINIIGGNLDLKLDFILYKENSGFVLSEIFFAGTKTPEGKSYRQDKFFEIYNNSSATMYADGLAIGESAFNTTFAKLKRDLSPDTRKTETAISAFYRVPGNGTDHPVLPGESIIFCDVAKDHKVDNANSFDLSGADFEWFDDHVLDVDVQEVPNLEKVYSASLSIWSLHGRGYNSYVLFKLDKSKKAFLEENIKEFEYVFEFNGNVKDITKNYYTIPNSTIIDAVELSAPSAYTWKVLSPELDLSWTHSGDNNEDTYGHSVSRKISHKTDEGRIVLLDTNNSEFDFNATAIPTPGSVE